MRIRLYLILILAFVALSSSAHSVVEEDGVLQVEHTWVCQGKSWSVSLNINAELYDYYQNEREHLAYRFQFKDEETPAHYFGFMLSEYDRPVMRTLAREFTSHAATAKDAVYLALTFVQSLPLECIQPIGNQSNGISRIL